MFVCMNVCMCVQWRRHTRACQGKCPGRNAYTLAAALADKSYNSKMIYQDILAALVDATNDLSMPCHWQQPGAATVCYIYLSIIIFIMHACAYTCMHTLTYERM